MLKTSNAEFISFIRTDLGFLRKKSHPTTEKEVESRNIVKIIQNTIRTGWCNGYGLVAIQIGIPIRTGWFYIPEHYIGKKKVEIEETVLVNPEILSHQGTILKSKEGCLSFPHKLIDTRRYSSIIYENNGKKYEADGLKAQIIQHEIDHMNGILIFDREYGKLPGRNEPCPCSSGIKFKKCCIDKY